MAPTAGSHRPRRWLPLLLLFAVGVGALQRPALAEEIYADDLPDWIPSVAIGAGIYSREVDGIAEGEFISDASEDSLVIPCTNIPGQQRSLCTVFTKGSTALDGFTLALQGQLLGPAWEEGPWRPRPFVQGGYGFPFKKRRITSQGQKESDFDSNFQEADLRVELIGDPQDYWWMGGGVAFQLPIDAYPTWVKFAVNYTEERTDAIGKITQATGILPGTGNPTFGTNEGKVGLTLRSIAPSIGVEALVARWGPIAVGFSADFFVGIPIGSTKKRFVVEAPGFEPPPTGGPGFFKYDADSPWFFGNAALRFVWLGSLD